MPSTSDPSRPDSFSGAFGDSRGLTPRSRAQRYADDAQEWRLIQRAPAVLAFRERRPFEDAHTGLAVVVGNDPDATMSDLAHVTVLLDEESRPLAVNVSTSGRAYRLLADDELAEQAELPAQATKLAELVESAHLRHALADTGAFASEQLLGLLNLPDGGLPLLALIDPDRDVQPVSELLEQAAQTPWGRREDHVQRLLVTLSTLGLVYFDGSGTNIYEKLVGLLDDGIELRRLRSEA